MSDLSAQLTDRSRPLHIHLIGVAGSGMSGLALLLLGMGHKDTGSGWQFLAMDTRPNYIDTTPPPPRPPCGNTAPSTPRTPSASDSGATSRRSAWGREIKGTPAHPAPAP